MKNNSKKNDYVPAYKVAIVETFDWYQTKREIVMFDDYKKAVIYADALFITMNYRWDSEIIMRQCDGGYEPRIYDRADLCIYESLTKYRRKWFW